MQPYLRHFENTSQLKLEMQNIGVDTGGLDIMAPKGIFYTFVLKGVDARAANIIKQEFLSKGGEAALAYHCLSDLDRCSDMILMATESQYRKIILKFEKQPFGLADAAKKIGIALDNLAKPMMYEIDCSGKKLAIGQKTLVMGILNVTPDSFSDGGHYSSHETAIARGIEMAGEGADIIDVGGESTRPGSQGVSAEEEINRVIPVIKALSGKIKSPISVDTSKPEVARAALDAGATLINDVTGLANPEMRELAAGRKVPVIIMHMLGEPRTMQDEPAYDDVVDDIIDFFRERVGLAEEAGIPRNLIIIDPGIGFGKTIGHNLEILKRLEEFRVLGLPVMVGASRKSFIGKLLDANVDSRLEGSLAAAVVSSLSGADIVRVHDVRETASALRISDAVREPPNP